MTIVDSTPNPRRSSSSDDGATAPLLPRYRDDEVGFDEFNGASFSGAVFNISTTIIGAGIMSLPATMKILGLVLGIAAIVFMAFLTDASVELLLRFSKAGKKRSYGGLMGDSFGKCGRILLQVAVLVNNIGVLIVYMIIIGDVLAGKTSDGTHHAGVLEGWFGDHWWNSRTSVLLVTTLFVFAPLSCFKRIDSLRFTSALSVALAVVFLVITAGIAITKLIKGGVMMPRLLPDVTNLSSFWNLFTVVPVLVTAYICHYNVHSIQNELEDSSQIKPVVRSALTLCSFVYIMTSLFGFLLFGDDTLDDVLANFDTDLGIPFGSILNDAVRVSYSAHLMLVFPIVFYPLRLNIDELVFPTAPSLTSSNLRFGCITASLITVIFLGANFIPSIWDAFQFTGATAAVCLGFIFPAAVTLKDRHDRATRRDKILAAFMIVLAVFSNAIAIYSDAYALFKKNTSPHE
ncbi:PREDICTED: probable sodium-coupled neutral amino acid transporter 6 [Tarenaya hassleriana]|uniref:probable sodium-coupled neutral amino acid transporter 6 n=1 Tax=Tarenaya hassleriana TaxID=28532 RepID=UPI00053C9558|nr:PREDICTED: probable sodium-coupled neutral amino acid transporter 6 [Tarenaya hassleriana]XP_010553945.1 PREDICTED: probable sodium-coupled neutral amino acid transporter 6 [Tarenaya hassleriana]XP_010553946.1 PREDICTED: probable sodium-coupled neutral amino acid transporter 6 [Tarenaya hassleriana]